MGFKNLQTLVLTLFLSCTIDKSINNNHNSLNSNFFYIEQQYLRKKGVSLELAETYPKYLCAPEIVYFIQNDVTPENVVQYEGRKNPIEAYQRDLACGFLKNGNEKKLNQKKKLLCEIIEYNQLNEEKSTFKDYLLISNTNNSLNIKNNPSHSRARCIKID